MRYRVSGVWRANEQEGVIFVEAPSLEQADMEAARRGLRVRLVTAVGSEPDDEPHEAQERERQSNGSAGQCSSAD